MDDFANRSQVVEAHKEKLKEILLSKYRSQRAIAGAIVGRKIRVPDILPSNKGNSRLISVNSISKHLNTYGIEDSDASKQKEQTEISFYLEQDSHQFNDKQKKLIESENLTKHFQTKLNNLKNAYNVNNAAKVINILFLS